MSKHTGTTPAVALINPKFPHNAGAAYRACAAWGAPQLWVSGSRMKAQLSGKRLPREERMRIYQDEVTLNWNDRIFDQFAPDVTPVAVEVLPTAEPLTLEWEHPEKALYVFGPEDGSLPGSVLQHCHRFIILPSDHCLNLSAAVNLVLGHRRMSRQFMGLEAARPADAMMFEERGWACAEDSL